MGWGCFLGFGPLPVNGGVNAAAYKDMLPIFGVKELRWPEQSPGLNPTEHLWDKLERWSQALSSNINV